MARQAAGRSLRREDRQAPGCLRRRRDRRAPVRDRQGGLYQPPFDVRAARRDQGRPDELQVAVTREQVQSAPNIEQHGEELSQADELPSTTITSSTTPPRTLRADVGSLAAERHRFSSWCRSCQSLTPRHPPLSGSRRPHGRRRRAGSRLLAGLQPAAARDRRDRLPARRRVAAPALGPALQQFVYRQLMYLVIIGGPDRDCATTSECGREWAISRA